MTWRVAGVYAHPDDETFGNSGSLMLHEGKVDYTLIVATSGEAGMIADPSLATRENLGEVREGEQLEALRTYGHGDANVQFLRYPDGGLADVDREELVGRIADILREARPHVVLTFGPEGVTRHADHIAAGEAATEAFHRLRSEGDRGDGAFQRLLHNAIPQSSIDRFWQVMRERGIDIGNPDDPFMPRGVPDETIGVRVDCGSLFKRKLEALAAHRTQAGEVEVIPEDAREEAFGVECFVVAWPQRQASEPVLTDLFEGLAP